ncbi:conserved membrane hypothetical protein [metagenome]|uniref:Cellulose synthase n=1 Tax=metagenome TaxID=256318 RepID=A0A2P2BWL2_9ZZZZ
MDDVTWGALALVLTALGGGYTYWAFRTRGPAAGTRGAALTLLPPALWLTGTLKMFTRIVDAITDWATHLVFSPAVWIGIILAGVSVVLFGVAGRLGGGKATTDAKNSPPVPGKLNAPKSRPAPAIDDDLSEIEAILKKRGIT